MSLTIEEIKLVIKAAKRYAPGRGYCWYSEPRLDEEFIKSNGKSYRRKNDRFG